MGAARRARVVGIAAGLAGLASAATLEIPASAPVGPGVQRPLYPAGPTEAEVSVARFRMAVEPVTNEAFAAFVASSPRWSRAQIDPVFADEGYLGDWAGATPGGSLVAAAPVTRVSWYAARAYCRAVGGRLPTEAEWEFAAQVAPEGLPEILRWYSAPTPAQLPAVGGPPNRWGLRDLHGLIWEWVEDFNAVMLSTDARGAGGEGRARFCGAGAAGAAAAGDYAAFMRSALRSSLEARSTVRNLGFRCAWDVEEGR